MTKTVWIIGAVVVVGAGIAAGVLLLGGRQPDIAASSGMIGQNISSEPAVVASVTPSEEPLVIAPAVVTSVEESPVVAEVTAPSEDSDTDDEPLVIDSLDDLFANAVAYSGKEIVARGTIVTQCISGCTFSLEDGTGVVAVELVDDALDNVLERGSVGRQVEVRGVVETSPQLVIVLEEPDDWNFID